MAQPVREAKLRREKSSTSHKGASPTTPKDLATSADIAARLDRVAALRAQQELLKKQLEEEEASLAKNGAALATKDSTASPAHITVIKASPSPASAPRPSPRTRTTPVVDLGDEKGEATRRAVLLSREEDWHLQWDAAKRAHADICESMKFAGGESMGADEIQLQNLQQQIDDLCSDLACLEQGINRMKQKLEVSKAPSSEPRDENKYQAFVYKHGLLEKIVNDKQNVIELVTNPMTLQAAGEMLRRGSEPTAPADAVSCASVAAVVIILLCRKNVTFSVSDFLSLLKPDQPPGLSRAALETMRELFASKSKETCDWVTAGGPSRLRGLIIAATCPSWRQAGATEDMGVEFVLMPLLRNVKSTLGVMVKLLQECAAPTAEAAKQVSVASSSTDTAIWPVSKLNCCMNLASALGAMLKRARGDAALAQIFDSGLQPTVATQIRDAFAVGCEGQKCALLQLLSEEVQRTQGSKKSPLFGLACGCTSTFLSILTPAELRRDPLWAQYMKLLADLVADASPEVVAMAKPALWTLLFACVQVKTPEVLAAAALEVIARAAEVPGDKFKLSAFAKQLTDLVNGLQGPLRARFNGLIPSDPASEVPVTVEEEDIAIHEP